MANDLDILLVLVELLCSKVPPDDIRQQVEDACERKVTEEEFSAFKGIVAQMLTSEPDTPERTKSINKIITFKFLTHGKDDQRMD